MLKVIIFKRGLANKAEKTIKCVDLSVLEKYFQKFDAQSFKVSRVISEQ